MDSATPPMVDLRLLGGASVLSDGNAVSGRSAQRRRIALLALLAVERRPLSRDKLIGYLWPEADTERARRLLSESVYILRKELHQEALLTPGDEVQLNEAIVHTDVAEFEDALEAERLEAAVAVYGGPLLEGFFVSDAPEFERWVDAERERLARRFAHGLRTLAEAADEGGAYQDAAEFWHRLAQHEPYNGGVVLRLMRALSAMGDRARALQHARTHAALLRAEFEAEPDPEVEELAAQLRDVPAPTAGQLDGVRVVRGDQDGGLRNGEATEVSAAPGLRSPAAEANPLAALAALEDEVSDAAPVAREEDRPEAAPAPLSAPGTPHRRRRSRWSAATASIAIALVVGPIAVLLQQRDQRRSQPEIPEAPDAATIAVLPFAVRGGAEYEYLGEGVVTLLSMSLNGAGELRAVDPYVLLSHAGDPREPPPLSPQRAREVAGALGAEMYVMGTVVESGGRLRITASLYQRHPAPLPVLQVWAEGAGSDVFSLVDDLSRQILVRQFHAPADRLSHLAALTTASLPALKAYLEGEKEFRAARYRHAAAAFRRAVREDPTFALAHYRLSMAAEWSFRFVEARQAAAKALRLSEPLSVRDYRLIAAWHSFLTGDADEAERLYDAILTEEPFDVEAWSGLAEVRAHYNPVRGRSIREAVPAFAKVLELAPNYGEARFHLMEVAASRGDRAAFDSLLVGVDPGSEQALSWQAARTLAWGSPSDAQQMLRRLQAAEEIVIGIAAARAAAHFRDLRSAESLAGLLTRPERPDSWRAAGHLLIAQAKLACGDWSAAAVELDTARRFEPDWPLEIRGLSTLLPLFPSDEERWRQVRDELQAWEPLRSTPDLTFLFAAHADAHAQLRLYLLGQLSVRLGEFADADIYRRELEVSGRSREGSALGAALARSIEAHRAWREGEPERALALLEGKRLHASPERIMISPFFSQAFDRHLRAEILRALDRPEEALAWYASLSESPDLLFWAAAHLRQSDLLARTGRRREASQHATQFRAFWAPSNPEPTHLNSGALGVSLAQ